MKILITPKDLIERCLWSDYAYYIIKDLSTDEKNSIIRENKEFYLDEKDAYVIGLLSVVYTDNLIHKMNQYLDSVLENKSFGGKKKKADDEDNLNESATDEVVDKNQRLISKDIILQNIDDFIKEFPEAYEPNEHWFYSLKEVKEYSKELMQKVNKLKTTTIQGYPCIKIKDIKAIYTHHIS